MLSPFLTDTKQSSGCPRRNRWTRKCWSSWTERRQRATWVTWETRFKRGNWAQWTYWTERRLGWKRSTWPNGTTWCQRSDGIERQFCYKFSRFIVLRVIPSSGYYLIYVRDIISNRQGLVGNMGLRGEQGKEGTPVGSLKKFEKPQLKCSYSAHCYT